MQILTAHCFIVSDMAQTLKALSKMALCVFCSRPTYSDTKSRNLSKPLALYVFVLDKTMDETMKEENKVI